MLIALYTLIRVTWIVGIFNAPADSMMPNFKPGQLLFTYKWADVGRNDVVAFFDTSFAIPNIKEPERGCFVGRVIAVAGDHVEIVEGFVQINGETTRQDFPVLYFWKLSQQDYQANARRLNAKPIPYSTDSVLVALTLSQSFAMQESAPMSRFDMLCFPESMQSIWGQQGAKWTMNHFGPVTVPKGHLFILGDNRNDSEDSRHRGFVPVADLIGKVIN